MKKLIRNNRLLFASGMLASILLSSNVLAQSSVPIACPGYTKPKVTLLGTRTGQKLQAAYDVYLDEEKPERERITEALEMLAEVKADEPFDQASVDVFLGKLMVSEDGRAKEALGILQKAAELDVLNDKDQVDLIALVANLSLQEEEYDNAITWYNKWFEKTCKQDGDLYTRLAQAHAQKKEWNEALVAADKAIAAYPEPNKNPYTLKIGAYYELKNYQGAVDVGEILVRTFPEEKTYWTQLAQFYMLVEDYSSALATFELAYRQGFLSKEREFKALSQLYSAEDIPFKSAAFLEKYVKADLVKPTETVISSIASAYRQSRDFRKAAEYYGKAAELAPEKDYYEKQGVMLLDLEDYKGAIAVLKKAIETTEDDIGGVHYALMQAYFYSGDYRQANVHAKEAMKDSTLRRSARAWLPYIKGKADNRGIKI